MDPSSRVTEAPSKAKTPAAPAQRNREKIHERIVQPREVHLPSMDAFKSLLESVMAPVLARLGNLEGGEESDVEDVEFIPVRSADASEAEEEEEEQEKIPMGAKPKRIQIVARGKTGVQKLVFSKGKKEP